MKIALCIPVHRNTEAEYTYSLSRLQSHSSRRDLLAFMVGGASLPVTRTQLAAEALAWGADWLLWMDADHTFPPDALERLLVHNLPVIGCNYPRRRTQKPSASVAPKAEGVEPVDFMGMGLCLISAEAMRAVPAPQFDARWEGAEYISEDVAFFRKLRSAGYQPHVDHALSREVGHIAETVLKF